MVDLVVRDTGCGMTPEVLRRIFDSFFSTKSGPDASGKGGTGLGLSMCREIIEAHHGRIRVDSTPGKGTAFMLKIPGPTCRSGGQGHPSSTRRHTGLSEIRGDGSANGTGNTLELQCLAIHVR